METTMDPRDVRERSEVLLTAYYRTNRREMWSDIRRVLALQFALGMLVVQVTDGTTLWIYPAVGAVFVAMSAGLRGWHEYRIFRAKRRLECEEQAA